MIFSSYPVGILRLVIQHQNQNYISCCLTLSQTVGHPRGIFFGCWRSIQDKEKFVLSHVKSIDMDISLVQVHVDPRRWIRSGGWVGYSMHQCQWYCPLPGLICPLLPPLPPHSALPVQPLYAFLPLCWTTITRTCGKALVSGLPTGAPGPCAVTNHFTAFHQCKLSLALGWLILTGSGSLGYREDSFSWLLRDSRTEPETFSMHSLCSTSAL